MLPYAVITMTGSSGSSSFAARRTPNPSPCGQAQVRQHHAGRAVCSACDRFGLVARLDDGVALRFERMAQHGAKRVFVLDEEDRGIRRRASSH